MSSWSSFWRSRPALRTARTITSVHTPIVRGTSPPGYFMRDVALGLGGVRVGVEHGLLRADQDVERIGDAVAVAIVRRRRPRSMRASASSGASSSRSPGRSARCELADRRASRCRRAGRPCAGSRRSTSTSTLCLASTSAVTRSARAGGQRELDLVVEVAEDPLVGDARGRPRRRRGGIAARGRRDAWRCEAG